MTKPAKFKTRTLHPKPPKVSEPMPDKIVAHNTAATKTQARKATATSRAGDNQPSKNVVTGTNATTLGQSFGEMVWLMTQSPLHKHMKIADLEWLLMPSIMLGQARVFRAGQQAVAVALWAYLTPEQAAQMGKTGKLDANGWRHGTNVMELIAEQKAGKKVELGTPELKEGELELWLVDLICPFGTPENKLVQICMADLLQCPLQGQKMHLHRTDATTGEKTVVVLGDEGAAA